MSKPRSLIRTLGEVFGINLITALAIAVIVVWISGSTAPRQIGLSLVVAVV